MMHEFHLSFKGKGIELGPWNVNPEEFAHQKENSM